MSTENPDTQLPTTKTTPSLPLSITLGGVEYKVSETPELKEFITAVGTVERSKLQSVVKQLRTDIENLRTVENPVNAQELTNTVVTAVLEQIKPTLDKVNNHFERQGKLTIEQHREAVLAQYGETIIPELITGDTIEAINASIPVAQAARARYATPAPAVVAPAAPAAAPIVGAPLTLETPQTLQPVASVAPPVTVAPVATPAAAPVVAPVAVPVRAVPDYQGPNIAGMNMEDFGKSREGLLKSLEQLV